MTAHPTWSCCRGIQGYCVEGKAAHQLHQTEQPVLWWRNNLEASIHESLQQNSKIKIDLEMEQQRELLT